jgi:integrase/recombinase XerD
MLKAPIWKNEKAKNELELLFEQFVTEAEFSTCLRPETIRGYRAVFHLLLRVMPEITGTELLTQSMLNEFFRRIKTRPRRTGKGSLKIGVKNSTIKTQWSKLNVFFAWLYRQGIVRENPLKNIRPPQVIYDDYRRLENKDIHRIYSAITRCSSNVFMLRRDTMMVSMLLFCGLRKTELISLQVRDIDLTKKEITIRGETSKSKKTRVLKLHPTLVLHIKDYLRERNVRRLNTEYLLASNRGDSGLTREGLMHWVDSLITKSGVKFHLHRFRHTFACKLAEADTNVFKIQKMMGHTNISMTAKYMRSMRTEEMGDDIEKITI